jgi:hypothetical protein
LDDVAFGAGVENGKVGAGKGDENGVAGYSVEGGNGDGDANSVIST